MSRNENLNLARTTTAKMLCFHFCFQFLVFISSSISFPFPAFPYAQSKILVPRLISSFHAWRKDPDNIEGSNP